MLLNAAISPLHQLTRKPHTQSEQTERRDQEQRHLGEVDANPRSAVQRLFTGAGLFEPGNQVDPGRLQAIRQQLITPGLLAYQKPLYQLLALPKPEVLTQALRTGQIRSGGELLRKIAGGAA